MKANFNLKWQVSALLICFLTFSYGQENEAAEKLYSNYQKKGIDQALEDYKDSSKSTTYQGYLEPLNELGYRLMMDENDLDAAEKVFKAQIDKWPDEANPYDSYGDLLAEKKDNTGAIKNYKKSLKLVNKMPEGRDKMSLIRASKSKLAKLEGHTTALSFLAGDWDSEQFAVVNGTKSNGRKSKINFKLDEENSILTGKIHDDTGKLVGKRIIAYDAVDEVYDMVYISYTEGLTGLDPSTLEILKNSSNQMVFIEKYTENGKQMKVKHKIKKENNNLAWEIHDVFADNSENLVSYMNFNKKN